MVNFHSMPCQLHCCGTHLGCQEVELQLCKPLPRAGPGSQLDVQNHVVYILPVFGSWSLFLHVWLNQPGPMTKWKVRKWICWLAPAMRTQAEVSDRGRIPWMVPQPALGLKTLRIWELLLTHWCRHSCSENLDIFSDKLHLLACSHLILNWSILKYFWNNCFLPWSLLVHGSRPEPGPSGFSNKGYIILSCADLYWVESGSRKIQDKLPGWVG